LENTAPHSPATAEKVSQPYRVLIVDDSSVVRGLTKRLLDTDAKIQIVDTASNGQIAIEKAVSNDAEVVVLDLEMPVMDGLTAIPLLLEKKPHLKIIVSSTLSLHNGEVSLKALSLGASDYVTKPTSAEGIHSSEDFKLELIHKVKALGSGVRLATGKPRPGAAIPLAEEQKTVTSSSASQAKSSSTPAGAPSGKQAVGLSAFEQAFNSSKITLRSAPPVLKPVALAIGSSTGGPQSLVAFFHKLPASLQVPIFITQHMPPKFTTSLAGHITAQTLWTCHEAEDGMVVQAGTAYLAPGDYHMEVKKSPDSAQFVIRLNQDPPENFCRPAVDVMLRSLVEIYGKKLLTVILTGMGNDGLRGSRILVENGGQVLAQDEETSVVWGMPGAVAVDGLCTHVLPLEKLPDKVAQIVQTGSGGL